MRYYQILTQILKSSLFEFLPKLSNEERRNWKLSIKLNLLLILITFPIHLV